MFKKEELVVRIVELKGNYYQFGLEQGKELISLTSLEQINQLGKLTINTNELKAKEIVKSVSLNLFQELKGLAEGLEIEIDTIIKLFSGFDVVFPKMGCTALVKDGYYVRNYDFSPDMYDARLVFTNPTEGYASVGFSHQVIGRLDGMNEKGLVVGLHFVNNEHIGEGFIATTIVRMLLEQCADIEEAVNLIKKIPHGYCYNYSITDQSGNSVIVEASPLKQIINFTYPLLCTNHFESNELREKNRVEIKGSVNRKKNMSSLLTEIISPMTAYRHFNDGSSPLFYKNYKEYFGTLHTVVYSPRDLSIIIGIGESCEPMKFSLKNIWREHYLSLKILKGQLINPYNKLNLFLHYIMFKCLHK